MSHESRLSQIGRRGSESGAFGPEDAGRDPLAALVRAGRLSRLARRLCPFCTEPSRLLYDGRKLGCFAGHAWSDPDRAEADVAGDKPRSAGELRRLRDALERADRERCRRVLDGLEKAVGGWLAPESRRN